MGLLDKLWDETVAGPRPSKGLGKLRKDDCFSCSGADPHVQVHTSSTTSTARTILKANSNLKIRNFWANLAATEQQQSAPEALAQRAQPRSPTVYDWIVISALDR